MGRRKDILLTIKNAIEGLSVEVDGELRTIRTINTLIDPTREASFPVFTITPAPETVQIGIMGLTKDRTMMVSVFGYTDGANQNQPEESGLSGLNDAAEDIVQKIIDKLTSATFLDMVACTFSIIQIGPVTVEHAELEEPLAYISMPLVVQWVE